MSSRVHEELRTLVEDLLLRDSVVLCRYGLPSKKYLRVAGEHLSKARPAIFWGDLDPLDLHVYLSSKVPRVPCISATNTSLRFFAR